MLYEIVIDGYVNPSRFEGFQITKRLNSTTVLTGQIVDQSALFGVLRTIRDLGIELISVNRLEEKRPSTDPTINPKEGFSK